MKKAVFILFLCMIVSSAYSQNFLVGGGLIYGTEVEKGGIDIRADFRVAPKWAIVPNINFFFPESSNRFRSSFTGINVDAHYIKGLNSEASIYPLFGINFSKYSYKNKDTGNRNSNTELGINLGGGFEYFFSRKVAGLFEIKYVLGDYDQGVLTFGILYAIN